MFIGGTAIAPLIRTASYVEFVGEVGEGRRTSSLANARALLFPIDWPEPFGLVMIEAMACGTPVIAFTAGSVPEVLDDGVTGFIVDDEGVAAAAVAAARLDRAAAGPLSNADSRSSAWQTTISPSTGA